MLADDTVLQPDLLVAAREAFSTRDLPTAPMLAVEVLSASTARIDRTLKRSQLEAAGCPTYWVVDPEIPAITSWQLERGQYVDEGLVVGDEHFSTRVPFPIAFSPSELLDQEGD